VVDDVVLTRSTVLRAALSNLICASLKEDPYGVTQRDIPKVLEAFVRYLSVLDALAAELEATADKALGGPEEREHARKVVEREVGEVQEGASSALPLARSGAPRAARRDEFELFERGLTLACAHSCASRRKGGPERVLRVPGRVPCVAPSSSPPAAPRTSSRFCGDN